MITFFQSTESIFSFLLVLLPLAIAYGKQKGFGNSATAVILWAVLFNALYKLFDLRFFSFYIYMLALFLCPFTYTFAFQSGRIYYRINIIVASIFSLLTIKSVIVLVIMLIERGASDKVYLNLTAISYFILYFAYLFFAWFLVRFAVRKIQCYLPAKYWLTMLNATLLAGLVINLSIEAFFSSSLNIMLTLILYLSNYSLILIMYYLTYLVSNSYEETLNSQAASQRLELQMNQLRHTADIIQRVRTERHELKNTYFYIDGLVKNKRYDELERYLDTELNARITGMEEIVSGSNLVDTLLTQKVNEACALHIPIVTEIDLPESLSVSESELCALLTNLLDNALEASVREENAEIQIYIDSYRGYLRIRIRNKSKNPVHIPEIPHHTTKEDKENHGIGLSVVKKIVWKYDGNLAFGWEREYFQVTVMLLNHRKEEER